MFSGESNIERILRIGQHVAKLWARVGCPVFYDSWGSFLIPKIQRVTH